MKRVSRDEVGERAFTKADANNPDTRVWVEHDPPLKVYCDYEAVTDLEGVQTPICTEMVCFFSSIATITEKSPIRSPPVPKCCPSSQNDSPSRTRYASCPSRSPTFQQPLASQNSPKDSFHISSIPRTTKTTSDPCHPRTLMTQMA